MPITADYEVSQNNPDIGTSTEGRSIGHVHDKSAPTGVRIILFMFMIGGCPEDVVKSHFTSVGLRKLNGSEIILLRSIHRCPVVIQDAASVT